MFVHSVAAPVCALGGPGAFYRWAEPEGSREPIEQSINQL
jgi:hypothetical protein